jgi:hypothetical protein
MDTTAGLFAPGLALMKILTPVEVAAMAFEVSCGREQIFGKMELLVRCWHRN